MAATATQPRTPKAPRWGSKNCRAKPLLEYAIRMGYDIHPNGVPKNAVEVYGMQPIYKIYKYPNFCNNLKNLRSKTAGLKAAATLEDAAIARQINKFPICQWVDVGVGDQRVVYPRWQGHTAQYLLRLDIKMGKLEYFSPSKLRALRPLYRLFPLRVFETTSTAS
mmetsp:Transcript_13649/g.17789  ORF Transcript_13649/g.17789 Transcript_13649/m.17789 type:complete len:165 (+) Transcript_13649:32-526(+)